MRIVSERESPAGDTRTIHKSADYRIRSSPRRNLTTLLPTITRSRLSVGLEFHKVSQAWHRNRCDASIDRLPNIADEIGECHEGRFSFSDAGGNAGA